jgi:hypothetical protein
VITEPTKGKHLVDDAKDVVVRFVESWSFDAELPEERLAELIAETTSNTPPLPAAPRASRGTREVEASLRQAFSGLRFDVEDAISDGEKVVVRGTASGRHTGAGGPLRNPPITEREFASNTFTSFASPTARSPSTGRAVTTSDSWSNSGSSPCATELRARRRAHEQRAKRPTQMTRGDAPPPRRTGSHQAVGGCGLCR